MQQGYCNRGWVCLGCGLATGNCDTQFALKEWHCDGCDDNMTLRLHPRISFRVFRIDPGRSAPSGCIQETVQYILYQGYSILHTQLLSCSSAELSRIS